MQRARSFLRRRATHVPTDASPEALSSESVEQSNVSTRTTAAGSSFAQTHPFEATARRRSRFASSGRSRTESPRLDPEKADSITRSMTKRWFGVEETGDTTELLPSISSGTRYVRSWLDGQPPPETQTDPAEPRPDAPIQPQTHLPTDSNRRLTVRQIVTERLDAGLTQTRDMTGATWRGIAIFCLGLLVLDVSLMFIALSHYFPFSMSRSPSSDPPSPVLPFREKYFKALVMENARHNFHPEFERGLLEAASHLRVHVRVERMQGTEMALQCISEAQDALYDGLVVSASDDIPYTHALKRAHQRNSVLMLGSLESHAQLQLNTLDHVGDCEADVGRLAGQAMREAGKKTALCLSHADNLDSIHRCRGFREAFGKQTYELSLNTMMQSELKSKLIPIILDDREINGLFVSDPRSFGLVLQILKSLNRLCTHKSARKEAECIYFGAYGTDRAILQAMKKRELQFMIDPQEYIRGYFAIVQMTLRSLGYYTSASAPSQSSLLSQSISFSAVEEAEKLLSHEPCFRSEDHRELHLKFLHFGSLPEESVEGWRTGLRNAARDLNVYVQFQSFPDVTAVAEMQRWLEKVDGIGLSISDQVTSADLSLIVDLLVRTQTPVVTYGAYKEMYSAFPGAIHVGYASQSANASLQENPAVQGYLSVLLMYTKRVCGQSPSGIFNTAT